MKIRNKVLVVVFFAAVFLFFGSASATNYSAPLVADTWLDTANPNTTHPTGDLTLYYNNGAWQWSSLLIKFDLSEIPANSTVVSSSLNIVQKSCSGYSSPVMYAKRVTSNWTEDSATWQIMQNRVTGQIQNAVFPCNVGSNIPFNVTDVVQSWVNGATTNYGFRVDPDTAQSSASFNFGIYGKGGYLPAYLQVYYNPPSESGSTNGGSTPSGGTTNPAGGSSTSSTNNSQGSTASGSSSTGSTTNATSDNNTASGGSSTVGSSASSAPTSISDAFHNPSKILNWPWWKKAIAIWAALMVVVIVAGGIFLLVRKISMKKGGHIDRT